MSLESDTPLPIEPSDHLMPKLLTSGTAYLGQPYVYIDENSVLVTSKPGQGILVDNVYGTTINGPVALFETLDNMKIGGGYWTINPIQLACIGSSAALPIPWLIPSTPRLLSSSTAIKNAVNTLKGI